MTTITTSASVASLAALLLALPASQASAQLPTQPAERCEAAPASGVTAATWIGRADSAIGAAAATDRVLRYRTTDIYTHNYESDRPYQPFIPSVGNANEYLSVATGALGVDGIFGSPATGTAQVINVASGTYAPRNYARISNFGDFVGTTRNLNPWATVGDWRRANDAKVVQRCLYRDYWRVVLERPGAHGPERLYIDPKSSMPVKLERTEQHYLWGPAKVEYVYTTWFILGPGIHLPYAAFRMVDGDVEIGRQLTRASFASADSTPALDISNLADSTKLGLATFLQPINPDTIRVGPQAFLLRNPGYTELVALARDTVFLLDATQGEIRSREDSVWIGKLFPDKHPIAVVITDLAWPHIAGMRYWVATGATIISHRLSRDFFERVLARKWTREPDLFEKRRATARLKFRAVDDSLPMAGGDLRLYAIDGVSSEGALIAYLAPEKFLWGSDFIQDTRSPTQYVQEVWQAVHRNGLTPVRAAAEHHPPFEWAVADSLMRTAGGRVPGSG